MIPRGVKALLVLSALFFLFVIGFLLIEQRQNVLVTKREIRRFSQVLTLTETRLQELMMERAKISLPSFSSGVKVTPVGYRDVYRVELPGKVPEEKPQTFSKGILQVCLDWILERFPSAKMEI
ncbi:hypothetical protein BREVNS_2197 [Brevinematales bacterium NS]|nr:hypothetical protein [Brevinematales bacterium]QJR22947.1 hypothetical protein BREVNS_2197 [Brevinematales bacterium NS]